jgi:predicted aldo/keto reductase-like oxidoreductase
MSLKNKGKTGMNRRQFLVTGAAATVAASLRPDALLAGEQDFHPIPASHLPTRAFGETGARIPLLTFGCGSRWMMYDEDPGLEVLNQAIDSGLIYLDTAHGYGRGKSEERIGRLMPARRKQVLIQTKIMTRDPDRWWKDLELSLKRMNIDYVDMLLLHSLGDDKDLAAIEVKGGPAEQLYRAKEQKLARWIGVSSHTNSQTLARFLRRHRVDGIQTALNVATNDCRDMGFEETALPVAVEQGLGIIAMKVMGQDTIVGVYPQYDYATCLRYALSLPITSATVGMPKKEHLKLNLEVVRDFKPYSPEEMQEIKRQAAGEIKTSFRNFMAGHDDLA